MEVFFWVKSSVVVEVDSEGWVLACEVDGWCQGAEAGVAVVLGGHVVAASDGVIVFCFQHFPVVDFLVVQGTEVPYELLCVGHGDAVSVEGFMVGDAPVAVSAEHMAVGDRCGDVDWVGMPAGGALRVVNMNGEGVGVAVELNAGLLVLGSSGVGVVRLCGCEGGVDRYDKEREDGR